MELSQAVSISPDHPCLDGHFPGNPLIPGTVILDRVIGTLSRTLPDKRVAEVIQVKFIAPLRPGETFIIHLSETSGGIRFECTRNQQIIATGRLSLVDKNSSM